jgi:predicted ABC-type ATPase
MHNIFTTNQLDILRVLLTEPDQPLPMAEIGRRLGKNPGVFQRGLNALERSGIIQSTRLANLRLLQLNKSSPFFDAVTTMASGESIPLPNDIYLTYKLTDDTTTHVSEPSGAYTASAHKLIIIAGPNGAGKTTFAREYLPHEAGCHVFINADYIAHGLSPFSPQKAAVKAGKLMLTELREHIEHRRDIAIETTLSGKRYARMIPLWQANGYAIKLIFLSLPDVELAIARVAGRIHQGGHAIPEQTIRRRFESGRGNFDHIYKSLVDTWVHYDNSGTEPVLIAEGER